MQRGRPLLRGSPHIELFLRQHVSTRNYVFPPKLAVTLQVQSSTHRGFAGRRGWHPADPG